MTEGAGIPLGPAVEGANRNDFKLVRQTLESIPVSRPEPTPEEPQGLCLDKGGMTTTKCARWSPSSATPPPFGPAAKKRR
jgi:hypothetical protein